MLPFFRICAFFSLLVNLYGCSSSQHAKGITFFEGTWEELLAEAKAQNKPVFVECYTTWCAPCRQMEKEVFPEKSVARFYNKRFINYRMDLTRVKENEFTKRYPIYAYPTLIYLDAQGNLLDQRTGMFDAEKFIEAGRYVLDEDSEFMLSQMNERYDKGDRSRSFITRYARILSDIGNENKAGEVIEELLGSMDESHFTDAENWLLIHNYVRDVFGKTYQYVLNNVETYAAKIQGDSVRFYLYSTAMKEVERAAFKKNEKLFFDTLLPIIESTSFNDNRETNVLNAKKKFYLYSDQKEQYAEVAIQFIEKGYHKLNMDHPQLNGCNFVRPAPEDLKRRIEAGGLMTEAWNFYNRVEDTTLLKKALAWSETALRLNKDYFSLNTQAALLFKLGENGRATEVVQEAIAQAALEGLDTSRTTQILQKYGEGVSQ